MVSLRDRFRMNQTVTLDGQPARVVNFSPGGNYVWIATEAGAGAMALSESEARKRVRVEGEPAENLLTAKQRDLIVRLRHGQFYISGADVTVARKLAKLGLVKLEDNGMMRLAGTGRSDGERWSCELVESKEQQKS